MVSKVRSPMSTVAVSSSPARARWMCGTSHHLEHARAHGLPLAERNVPSSRPTESVKMPRVSTDQRMMGAFAMTVPRRVSASRSSSRCASCRPRARTCPVTSTPWIRMPSTAPFAPRMRLDESRRSTRPPAPRRPSRSAGGARGAASARLSRNARSRRATRSLSTARWLSPAERGPDDVLEMSGGEVRTVREVVDVRRAAQDGDGRRSLAEQAGQLGAPGLILRGRLPVGLWVFRHRACPGDQPGFLPTAI